MASSFGMMVLLYLLFSKFVPMISIWEMKVGLHPHRATAHSSSVISVPAGSTDAPDNPLPTDAQP